MKGNHIFSFPGGDILAKMGAWWFVSYSYYIYVDRTHRNWYNVSTEATRRSVYNRSKEYHTYWLTEVLEMERLEVHGNGGNLSADEIKRMAKEILSVVSGDGGISAIEDMLNKLKAQYDVLKNS